MIMMVEGNMHEGPRVKVLRFAIQKHARYSLKYIDFIDFIDFIGPHGSPSLTSFPPWQIPRQRARLAPLQPRACPRWPQVHVRDGFKSCTRWHQIILIRSHFGSIEFLGGNTGGSLAPCLNIRCVLIRVSTQLRMNISSCAATSEHLKKQERWQRVSRAWN